MKTWSAKQEDVVRKWWLVDASNQNLGRLSTQIANILRGKNKPIFTPHVDTGDFVVVINAEKITLTGKKWDTKKYYRHSHWFGLKERTASEMLEKSPSDIIIKAVTGMLPKNRLAEKQITKLKVYSGSDHPHGAQNPEKLNV